MLFSGDTTIEYPLEVPDSVTCTILPGTKIRLSGDVAISIKGLLIAQGTAEKPILISCEERDRGSTEKPCWQGFTIAGQKAHAIFRFCRFEGAFKNLVWENSPVFDSCEFAGNHYALYCSKNAAPHISGCKFYRNVYALVADGAKPILLNNVITENTVGIYLLLNGALIDGKNVISGNTTNIRKESWSGKAADKDTISIKYLWDIIHEMY